MSDLVETPSGLVVPESALPPPSSIINPFDIIFPSEDTAEKFATRCRVRWQYIMHNINDAKEDDPPKWRAIARRGNGIVHDTLSPGYQTGYDETELRPFVEIKKLKDDSFVIVNKFE